VKPGKKRPWRALSFENRGRLRLYDKIMICAG
jgi:hypothetical protein